MKKTDVDFAVLHDMNMTREQIAENVAKDMDSVLALLYTIRADKRAMTVVVDIFWNRYLALKEKKLSQPELNLEKNG